MPWNRTQERRLQCVASVERASVGAEQAYRTVEAAPLHVHGRGRVRLQPQQIPQHPSGRSRAFDVSLGYRSENESLSAGLGRTQPSGRVVRAVVEGWDLRVDPSGNHRTLRSALCKVRERAKQDTAGPSRAGEPIEAAGAEKAEHERGETTDDRPGVAFLDVFDAFLRLGSDGPERERQRPCQRRTQHREARRRAGERYLERSR